MVLRSSIISMPLCTSTYSSEALLSSFTQSSALYRDRGWTSPAITQGEPDKSVETCCTGDKHRCVSPVFAVRCVYLQVARVEVFFNDGMRDFLYVLFSQCRFWKRRGTEDTLMLVCRERQRQRTMCGNHISSCICHPYLSAAHPILYVRTFT